MPRPTVAEPPTGDVRPRVAHSSPQPGRLTGQIRWGMRWVSRWIQFGRRIISISAAQVGATAITSALGFVFWWAAARIFTPEIVGFSAAATSAMLLLGTLSASGLGTMLIKELPSHPRQSGSLILASGLLAGVVGIILGLAFAGAAPLFSDALRPLAANWGTASLFAAGVGVTGITLLVDQAVLGLLREQTPGRAQHDLRGSQARRIGRIGSLGAQQHTDIGPASVRHLRDMADRQCRLAGGRLSGRTGTAIGSLAASPRLAAVVVVGTQRHRPPHLKPGLTGIQPAAARRRRMAPLHNSQRVLLYGVDAVWAGADSACHTRGLAVRCWRGGPTGARTKDALHPDACVPRRDRGERGSIPGRRSNPVCLRPLV